MKHFLRIRSVLRRKRAAWAALEASEFGPEILRDLREFLRPDLPAPVPASDQDYHDALVEADAMRKVWLHIQRRLNMTDEQIEARVAAYIDEEDENAA